MNALFTVFIAFIQDYIYQKLVWKIPFLYSKNSLFIALLNAIMQDLIALAIKSIPSQNLKLFSDPLDRQVNEPLLGHIFGSPRKVQSLLGAVIIKRVLTRTISFVGQHL